MVAIPSGKIHCRRYHNGSNSGVSDSHNYEAVNTGDGQSVSLHGV